VAESYGQNMGPTRVAEYLRRERARIAERWRAELRSEDRAQQPVLLSNIQEFLEGLADWIDGNTATADQAFGRLVEGSALTQLGYGVGIETLSREYSKLRVVLLRELLELPPSDETRTELIRMHEGMDRAVTEAMRRYAARRDEVRERFISILGHDLRDPLATVTISANALASSSQMRREHRLVAARIRRACDRMQRMIDDVLDFARGHLGGGIPANPTLNDLGEICHTAVDEIAAANPQREITLEITGDLRGPFDRDRVIQALVNLVSNAIHHGDGPIEVTATEATHQRTLITTVTSHGPVIPANVLAQIFDPFSGGDPSSPRSGLGLGLYIVNQIALGHGATCKVTSTEAGTTFSIRWPRSKKRVAATG
jgi:signal transduction histidine kinase